MNQLEGPSLREQRELLRLRLREQRQRIALRIDPPAETPGEYPRSKTMRFLMQRPQLLATLGSIVAAKLVGPRAFKGIATALTVIGIVRSNRRERQD
jgi:hypothetical protein